MTIYQRAKRNGAYLECTCIGISPYQHERLFKGARIANKKKVLRVALMANVITEEQAKMEMKHTYFNPYDHYVTRTHVIYVHSATDHFIRIQ